LACVKVRNLREDTAKEQKKEKKRKKKEGKKKLWQR